LSIQAITPVDTNPLFTIHTCTAHTY
jgi:hypothetical protein